MREEFKFSDFESFSKFVDIVHNDISLSSGNEIRFPRGEIKSARGIRTTAKKDFSSFGEFQALRLTKDIFIQLTRFQKQLYPQSDYLRTAAKKRVIITL